MNHNQLKLFHTLLKELGYDEETKRTLVAAFSSGRTLSSKDLNPDESTQLILFLKKEIEKKRSGSEYTDNSAFIKKVKSKGASAYGYKKGEKVDWIKVINYIVKFAEVQSWEEVKKMDTKTLNKLLKKLQKVADWKAQKRFEEQELNKTLKELGISNSK